VSDLVLPLELFSRALIAGGSAAVRVVDAAGADLGHLPLARYLGPAGEDELDLLRSLPAPVLDVGCGPGRHVSALVRDGVQALGIDVSAEAVRMTRQRGGRALRRSIFDALPRTGQWGSALLLDGNIGIGGHPGRLLERVSELLRPGGLIVVEVDGDGDHEVDGEVDGDAARGGARHVRLEGVGLRSHWFPWGALDRVGIHALAAELGLGIREEHVIAGRDLAVLARP
jgi:SAM-dependent methyltransferase